MMCLSMCWRVKGYLKEVIEMSETIVFASRNIKRYFRDTGVMLFSFLSVFIVVGLYMFFLTDMQIESINAVTGNLEGIDDMVISWVVGGLLCIPAISVPLLILCFKVDDLVDGIQDDLFVTPVKRSSIMFGYILSAWIVGFLMTLLTLLLCEIFIVVNGGQMLSFIETAQVIGILSIAIFAFSGMSFFVILLLKSKSAVMVVISMLNTLLGFFLGLFVPIGMLPANIATGIKILPPLQVVSLLRKILMKESLDQVLGATNAEIVTNIKDIYGVDIIIGEHLLKTFDIMVILVIFSVVFYGGCIFIVNRIKRK